MVRAAEVEAIWRQAWADTAHLIAGVRTDPQAPYGRMVAVLDALQTAGATRISLQRLDR